MDKQGFAGADTDTVFDEQLKLKAKERVVELFERSVDLDPVLDAQSVAEGELQARGAWVLRTKTDLLRAGTGADDFWTAASRRLDLFKQEMPAQAGSACEESREAFFGAVIVKLGLCAFELKNKSAHSIVAFKTKEEAPEFQGAIGRWVEEAKKSWTRERAPSPRGTLAEGAPMAIARRSPEERLRHQANELRERFGFKSIQMENRSGLSVERRSALLERAGSEMGKAARALGIEESQLGFGGVWNLKIMEAGSGQDFFDHKGYVNGSGDLLSLVVEKGASDTMRHEWVHMLDFAVGKKFRVWAASPGSGVGEEDKQAMGASGKFSQLPERLQKLMPEAHEGYLQAMGAAQGLAGKKGFEELERKWNASFDELCGRMSMALIDDPRVLMGMDAQSQRALMDDLKGPLKNLLGSEAVETRVLTGKGAGELFRAHMDGLAEKGGAERAAASEIAKILEERLGCSWRQYDGGQVVEGLSQIGACIEKTMGREQEGLARLSLSKGANGQMINPDSDFAVASKFQRLYGHCGGYYDDKSEMLARAVARGGSVIQRLELGGSLFAHGASWRFNDKKASAPSMGAREQKELRKGWAKLTSAAGMGPLELKSSAADRVEAALAAPVGKEVAAVAKAGVEWVAGAAKASRVAGAFVGGAWGSVAGPVGAKVAEIAGMVDEYLASKAVRSHGEPALADMELKLAARRKGQEPEFGMGAKAPGM